MLEPLSLKEFQALIGQYEADKKANIEEIISKQTKTEHKIDEVNTLLDKPLKSIREGITAFPEVVSNNNKTTQLIMEALKQMGKQPSFDMMSLVLDRLRQEQPEEAKVYDELEEYLTEKMENMTVSQAKKYIKKELAEALDYYKEKKGEAVPAPAPASTKEPKLKGILPNDDDDDVRATKVWEILYHLINHVEKNDIENGVDIALNKKDNLSEEEIEKLIVGMDKNNIDERIKAVVKKRIKSKEKEAPPPPPPPPLAQEKPKEKRKTKLENVVERLNNIPNGGTLKEKQDIEKAVSSYLNYSTPENQKPLLEELYKENIGESAKKHIKGRIENIGKSVARGNVMGELKEKFAKKNVQGTGLKTYTTVKNGKLGNLSINENQLKKLRLVAKKGKTIVYDGYINYDLYLLLKERFNTRKKYSPQSIELYKKLLQMGGVEMTEKKGTKKLPLIHNSYSKFYKSNDELVERMKLILGTIKSGNKSPHLKNELSEILDILVDAKVISKEQASKIFAL